MKTLGQALLVVCALVLVWGSVRLHHPDLTGPLHFDEWVDIGLALDLVRDESFRFKPTDSGIPEVDNDIRNRNLEFGFFVLLGELSLLGNIDLLRDYHHLAPLLAVLRAAALFVFVRAVTGAFLPALFAAAFIATTRSNNNLLGVDYFLPLTVCMPFLLLLLTGLIEAQRVQKGSRIPWLLVSAVSLGVLATNHPPSLVTGLLLSGLVLILSPQTWKDPRPLFALAGMGTVLAVGLFALLWQGSLAATAHQFVEFLVIPRRWHISVFLSFPLTYFAPAALLALALVGLMRAVTEPSLRFLAVWFIAILISDYAYRELRTSVLLPYQRMWHYWQLSVAALGGIGLAAIVDQVRARLPQAAPAVRHAAMAATAAAGMAAVLLFPNRDPYLKQVDLFRHDLAPFERTALDWVRANYPPEGVLYTPPNLAPYVRPLTGMEVAYGPRGDFMRGDSQEDLCRAIAAEPRAPTLVLMNEDAGLVRCSDWNRVQRLGPLSVYQRAGGQEDQREAEDQGEQRGTGE